MSHSTNRKAETQPGSGVMDLISGRDSGHLGCYTSNTLPLFLEKLLHSLPCSSRVAVVGHPILKVLPNVYLTPEHHLPGHRDWL